MQRIVGKKGNLEDLGPSRGVFRVRPDGTTTLLEISSVHAIFDNGGAHIPADAAVAIPLARLVFALPKDFITPK